MGEVEKIVKSLSSGISETVPMIYKDGLQPAVQEVGKGLHTISKTVHIALAPVSALVWGFEQISDYVKTALPEKLKNVPEENIISPDLTVAGPALEAMGYTAHREELRDFFINLLATSMDSKTMENAHPSFVEIIKQITPDEAKIIKLLSENNRSIPIIKIRLNDKIGVKFSESLVNFSNVSYEAGCDYPDLGPSYLENIERLGLVNLSYDVYNTTPNAYDLLENHSIVNKWREIGVKEDKRFEIQRGAVTRTAFGIKFFKSCVFSK